MRLLCAWRRAVVWFLASAIRPLKVENAIGCLLPQIISSLIFLTSQTSGCHMGVHPAVLCKQKLAAGLFISFLFPDFLVPAPTRSLLLSQEENPAQRPEASEPAYQRQRRAETGRLRWGSSTVTPPH